jgi:regulatory protein
LTSKATEQSASRDWRYVLRLLTIRDRSEHEVRQRLSQRGVDGADIDAIVERLHRHRYLDDRRFAEGMAERARRRGHGSLRLRAALGVKGVARDEIDAVVAATFADEEEQARKVLRKRYKAMPEDDAARARAARFLLQRGFPPRLVLAILKEGC